MWNRTVSMAAHYTIWNNEGINSKLIITQPVFNIVWQSWYQIKSLDSALLFDIRICKLPDLHIH